MIWTPTYGEMERLIVANLHRIRAISSGVIVHIPRSGTAPAGMIATYLPAPLASVEEYCSGIIPDRKCPPFDRNNVILVDDCISQGKQGAAAIDRIMAANPDARVTMVAVYDCVRDGVKRQKFPYPLMTLAKHHGRTNKNFLYPYYIWKSPRLKHVAVDFDGVLCRDATKAEDDDGSNYLRFLKDVEPKFLPMDSEFIIGAIVTARCEKYREETVDWLNRHGVRYGALHMGPWQGKAERTGKAARWKSDIYGGLNPKIRLFIESSEVQSREIHKITGKPVFSIETMTLHE